MPNYIKNSLEDYLSKNRYPFHMPGHKRNLSLLPSDLAMYDLTEIPETDDLHSPENLLLEASKRAANLFGADETLYLVNGATVGILSIIYALSNLEKTVLVARNCHKSVYSGLMLTNVVAKYIYPEITNCGFAGVISPLELKLKLDENPDIGAFVLTSPTYEGLASDIKGISKICKEKNVILIVDEAHGSHFAFSENFPKTSLEQGADIVINSLHKTLPALTQTALLHINNIEKNEQIFLLIKKYMAMLQTSSPSYIFMTTIDECIKFLENSRDEFEKYTNYLLEFHEELRQTSIIKSLANEIGDINKIDISRLTFCLNNNNAKLFYEDLRNKHSIEPELYSLSHIIAISTVADDKFAIDKLKKAILEEDRNYTNDASDKENSRISSFFYNKENCKEYNLFEMFNKKSTLIPLEEALNHVSIEFLIPYPPGIPIVLPGEKINKDVINFITDCINQDLTVYGVDKLGKIKILEEKQNGNGY